MSKKRIFTIGFDLPGDEFEYVPFESDRSLLDADIVLYEVGFGQFHANEDYEGNPLFSKSSSPHVAELLAHWRSELTSFVNAGKFVIVYVTKPLRYFRYTGKKAISGTGRSQVTTNLVAPVSSYDAIPNITHVEGKTGREVKLAPEATFLAPYWKECEAISGFEAFIDGEFSKKVLVTKVGEKTVGAVTYSKGTLLFLPPLRFDEKKFWRYADKKEQTFWTSEALKFGKRFLGTLIALAQAVASKAARPTPGWALHSSFALAEESQIQASIAKITRDIARMQKARTKLEQQMIEVGRLRGLLYETGSPLEHAVREALILFGFTAKNYKESDSEFDVVFESDEGRFIGEVEGKDNRAVNIDKLDQLERNLREDFARDGINEFAKGVLFGNAERLISPPERGESFTAKCVTASKRGGIALIRTADMFAPARYLRDTTDPSYAALCRRAIFNAPGEIAFFPPPPVLSPQECIATEPSQTSENEE